MRARREEGVEVAASRADGGTAAMKNEDQMPDGVESGSVAPSQQRKNAFAAGRADRTADATMAVVDPPVVRRPHRDRDRGGRLLSTQAAADHTGWPYTSIIDMVHRGLLPVVRIPGSRRMWFDREDLNRAIDSWKERLE
jgi:hypothetical protein